MARRSPIATATRIRVRVRQVERPAGHFQPLIVMMARMGYFEAITASVVTVADAAVPAVPAAAAIPASPMRPPLGAIAPPVSPSRNH